ncbi:MAG: tRNA nuclease WapA precursor [Planctomycetes bacterium ADurb.Bin126]|nr:MAG: tRNA nuclease WapA precursor [Planctomycetes bacterium ADurb.Bin126]
MNAADSGSIDFNSLDATLGGLKGSRNLDMGGNALSIGNNGQSTEYSGVLGNGALTKDGSGELILSGSNTYTGTTTISAGVLSVSSEDNLGANPASFTADQLTLDGGTLKTTATFTIDDSNRGITLGAGGGTVQADSSATLTVANVTAGGGSLAKSGDGTVVLSGTNTYTGKTTVSAGVLSVSSEGNLGANPASFAADQLTLDGGTLKTTATFTIDDSNRGITLGAGGGTVEADSSSTLTVANVVAGGGSLTKDGSGALILSGTNTYTGKTTVSAGTLSISSEDNLGANPASFTADQLTLDGGTLKTTATFTIDDSNRGITLGTGGSTVEAGSSTTLTVASIIDGSGSLTKDGSGSLTLGAANTFGGDTRLAAGTLIVGNASALQNSTLDMNAADSGSIDFSTYDATLGGLKGSRSLDMDGRTLSIGNNGQSTEYSGVLSDGALAKIGSGTLTLSGSNTYTGKTTISAGTLSISAEDNLGANPASFTADQLTLDGGTLKTTATFTIDDSNRGITLGAGGGTLEADASTTLTVANVTAGSGSLAKSGDGTVVLSGTNTYTGKTTVSAGTLSISSEDNLGANPASFTADQLTLDGGTLKTTATFTIDDSNRGITLGAGGGTVQADSTTTLTVANVVAGGGSLTKDGSGALILSGTNTYTGKTKANAGTLSISSEDNLGANPTSFTADQLTLDGGTLKTTATFTIDDSNRGITLGSGGGTVQTDSSTTLTVANVIDGSGSLVKDGSGSLTLDAANTFSGDARLAAGTLIVGNVSALQNSTLDMNAADSGSIDFSTYDATLGGLKGSRSLDMDGRTLSIGNNGQSTEYSGVLSDGALAKIGSGTLTLSGSNTYTGKTTISAGTLSISAEDNLGANPASFTADQLTLDGGTLKTTATFIIDDSNRGITLGAGGGTLEADPSTTLTVANVIDGSGSLVKDGSGSLTLGAANTFSGDTRLAAGTLILGAVNALQNSTLDMNAADAGSIDFSTYDATLGGLKGSRNLDMGGRTLSIGNNGQSTEYSGALGNGALTKIGSGVLTLSGSNTYSGVTTVSAGTLGIQHANALGDTASGTTVSDGAALEIQGGITTAAEPLTINGSGTSGEGALRNVSGDNTYSGTVTLGSAARINSDSGTLTLSSGTAISGSYSLTFGGAGDVAVSSVIATASLTKDGPGVLTLSGANTYAGNTTISAGTLKLGASGVIPDGSGCGDVTVNGTLDLNGYSETINGLSGSGTVDNLSGSGDYGLYVGENNATSQFDGVIQNTSGTLALVKTGTGTLTLAGANTYSGDTTIGAGTLKLGASGAIPDGYGCGNVTVDGTLDLNGYSETINGLSGSGTVDNASGTGAYTLTVGGNDAYSTFNGTIQDTSGTLALTKMGWGTFTLSGSNTYSGETTVSEGVLNIQHANALGSTSSGTTISDGACLEIEGDITTAAEPLTLYGGYCCGTAWRNVWGDNTFTGPVTVASSATIESYYGTLTLNSPTAVSGGYGYDMLGLGGYGDIVVSSPIAFSGDIYKYGSGKLTFSGDNTYSGYTYVYEGTLNIQHANALGGTANGTYVWGGTIEVQGGISTAAEPVELYGSCCGASWRNVSGDNTFTGPITAYYYAWIDSDSGTLTLNSATAISGGDSYDYLVFGGTGNIVVSSPIAFSGSIIKDGSGRLTLSGDNTYSGYTDIYDGTLRIQHANALGSTSSETYVWSGTLEIEGGITTAAEPLVLYGCSGTSWRNVSGDNTFSGAVTVYSDARIDSDSGTLTLDSATALSGGYGYETLTFGGYGDIVVSSPIEFSGNIVKDGYGQLTLSGSNTYTGDTTVSAGTLKLGASGVIPDGSGYGNVTVNGTLDLNGHSETINGLSGSGNIDNIDGPACTLTVGGDDATSTFGGIIQDTSGMVALMKTGAGTLTLGGSNAYRGETRIAAGTLALGNASALQNSTLDMNAADAGSIDFSTYDATLGGLKGSRNVDMGGNTISIGSNNLYTTYGGVLSNGALIKVGTGTLWLTGANTYSGGTTVYAGTLRGTVPGSHPDPYVSAAASVNEGSELTANFYWNDSWYVAQYWTVNWGDGSPVETVPVGQYGTSATHVYADSHAGRQITATAMAADGAHTATPATVVVNNVAPSVSIVGQSTGLAGTAITLTGRATDVAGPNDPLSYSWAVTRDGQPYTLPPEVVTNERTLTFTPSQSGSYSATLTVTDGDSGSTPESHGITVSATGVVAASDGSGGVTIAWSSVSGADYYNILRDDILFAEQITATAYTDTESAWDSSYIYKVWAYGTGVNEQVGTSAAAMQAPDAVSNLEATVDAQERTVELTWTGSVSSGSYDVYRSTTQGQLGDCVARAVSATTWEDTYGQAGTFYYTIKAVNAQQESASSSQVTAVMPSAPSVPDAPSNAQIETAAGSVTVSWSAVTGATSYNVYKESTIVAMTAQTTWTDEFASSSSSSTYSVTAVNAAGESQNTLAGSAEPGAQYNPFEYCCGGLWLSFDGGDTASLAFRDADDDDYRFARMNASAAGMYGYFDESWQWHEITAADRAGFTYTFEYPAAWPSEEVGSGSTGSFLRLWIDDGLQENPPDTGDLDYIELGEEYTAEELGFGYCSGGTWIDTTAYFWAEGVNAVANASIILRVNTNLGNNDVGRTYDDATASVYHLWTDLEVDADNNDFSGLPEGTTAEEGLEDGTPSKYIALPFEDREKYVPIVVELLNDVIANQTVTFTFASPLALYKADKTAITSEQEYTVSALGLSAGRNTLYMKGTGIGGGSIAVELGAPDIAITVDDSVNATVIDQIVACACCGSSIGPDGDYFGQDSYAGSPVEISADGQDMVIGAVPELIFCGNAVAIFEGDEIRLYDFPGFQPRTEGQGIFERTTSGFCETRPDGTKYLFAATCGKLQSQKDPGGNETEQEYNEDGTIASTTTVSGDITTTVSYTYSDGRVTSTETTEQETGQQAVNVRKAYYTYYGAEAVGGNEGDLKLITIKDDQNNVVEEKYYRYYKSGESNGFQHGIKMYFDGPSFARLKQAVSGWETADDSTVKPYATDYFEYDSQQRVTTRSTQGGGCSSMCDGIGTSIFEYTVSSNTDGYNSWKYKQVEKLPGYDTNDPYNTQNTSVTVYSNFAGQTMLQITKQDATGTAWYEYTRYDDEGRTILTASTSAITGFDEQYADLLHEVDGNLYYLDDDSGVIYVTEYYAATTATETTAGGVEGYFHQSSVQQGELDTPVLQSHVEYFARHIQGKSAYPTANSTVYRNTDGTGAETTSYAYTWIPNTLQTQTTVVSLPVVSTAQNGSGTANQSTTVYDSFGRVTWTKDAEGFLTHMAYDDATGAVVKMITDVDTTETGDFTGLPSGWSTPTGGGAHLITQYEVDSLGRTVKNTDANGVVSYTVYRDDEYTDSGTGAKITGEVRTYPNWDSTNHRPNGPISISRMIVVGEYRYSEYLTVSVSPSLDGSNEPTGLETFMASDIQSLSRTYYNVGGQTTESRQYSDLTGVTYSTAANLGTKGTNYLSTIYSYNRRGWMKRIEDSAGTIRRIVYDNLGRTLSEWIGTDDTPTSGSWSPDNMTGTDLVQLSATIYDGGSTGDGLVTASRTFFGSGANDYYETVYDYDWRNRQIGSRGPDNVASLSTLDNLGQVTMSQIYVDADTDFVIDSGELRAKNEAFYDDQGRTYKTVTYSIDPSDGSQLGSVIDSQTWYNPRGMVMKTSDALGLFSKTQYDGAGRAVASYASLDSTEFSSPSYGDADDVSGDTVLNVTVTVYSGDRVSQIKRGTVYGGENDNMVAVQKYWYDTTADGNGSETGRLTGVSTLKALATLAGTSADYVTTLYQYDSAGRQNVTITPDPDGAGGLLPTKYESTYDLLGRPTYSKTFKKDGQTETLLSQSRSLYNSAGQASASRVYEVASGSAGDYLETTYAYDGLGRQVKTTQPNGAFTKTLYDSWGRVTGSYLGTDEGATVDATNVTADTIVEQTIPYYDSLGRVWMTVSYQRHDDGSGTGALTTSNARATYDVIWFDDLGRTRWSATYGDNGGTAITSQSYDFDGDGDGEDYSDAEMTTRTSANSDDYILSQAAYNGYGQVFETTDNKGLKTRTYFDDVGRKTYVAENYDDFGFSSGNPVNTGDSTDHSKDRVTRYVYNVFGLLTQLVALDANGDGTQTDNETTSYVYALDLQASAAGSPVKDNALLRAVSYPDGDSAATTISTLNAGNTGDFVATTYVASGLEATRTDQREVEHTYAYDFLGRRTANAVTDYPASVDDTVLRIEWAYDDLGRVASVTSYDAATSGNIVNQVTFTYDGWSNVTSSKQEHDGEVDGSTPQVQYTYADGASGGVALYNRLTKVTYPDGREVFYNYPSSGIGAVLSRLDNIADDAGGTTKYAQYTYLGASTIVQVAHPAVQNNLVLSYGTGGTYAGWDRFGRVIQQTWTVNGSAVDSYAYGYDMNSNRLYRENLKTSNFDELYSYDGLNRLEEMNRGNLDGSKLFLTSTAFGQAWTLDQLGNWTGFDDNGTSQTRTHNAVNEITGISNWADPAYDAAGNMIRGPKPGSTSDLQHYTYDAWNRMAAVKADSSGEPGATIAVYEFDGLNRRIEETAGLDTQDFFFNEQWQVLEVRLNGDADPLEQCLWDIRYIDAMVVRWFDGNTDGDYADLNYLDGNQELVIGVDSILFCCQDANMNTTAVVDGAAAQSSVTAGEVVEYYAFSAYGVPIVLEADWTVRPDGSAYKNWSLFAGYYFDEPSGLYLVRNRVYQAEVGRWIQRDPVGYVDGSDLYEYTRSQPAQHGDPYGTITVDTENPDIRQAWARLHNRNSPTANRLISLLEGFELCLNVPIIITITASSSTGSQGGFIEGAPQSYWTTRNGNPIQQVLDEVDIAGLGLITINPLQKVLAGTMSLWTTQGVRSGWPLDEAIVHEASHVLQGLVDYARRNNIRCCFVHNGLQPPTAVPASARGYYSFETGPYEFNAVTNWENSYLSDIGAGYQRLAHSVRSYDELISLLSSTPGAGDSDAGRRLVDELDARMQMEFLVESDQSRQFRIGQGGDLLGLPVFPYDENAYRTVFQPGLAAAIALDNAPDIARYQSAVRARFGWMLYFGSAAFDDKMNGL